MQQYPTVPDPQQAPLQQPAPDSQQAAAPSQGQPLYAAPYAPPPAAGAPNAPGAPQSNRNRLLIGGGIGCGVLLLLCMCVGVLGTLAALGSTPVASNAAETATSTTQMIHLAETPTPTATANPNAGAAAYVSVVTLDGTTLGNDLNIVSDECGNSQDLSACRAALVVARDDSASFLKDLDAHPTPPCLVSTDQPLRAALRDIQSATQEVIDGIDTYDVSKVQDGSALMQKATKEVNSASSELDKAKCS